MKASVQDEAPLRSGAFRLRYGDKPAGKALMVTGTDTGVGKTVVACALAAEFRNRGLRVGVMKPVETGVGGPRDSERPRDALLLKRFSGSPLPIHAICPYRFRAPLAPWVAARLENRRISLPHLGRAALSISRSHDLTIIEGAGGLLVPLTRRHTVRDLARSLHLPVLIVTRLGLGTINHTLLTLEAAHRGGLRVLGVVLNHGSGRAGPADRHNPGTLRAWARAPILGVFPHVSGHLTPLGLAAHARRSLDMTALLDGL